MATGEEQVRALRRGDTASAGEVLAESHARYPAFVHLWPEPAVRRRALVPFLRSAASDAAGLGAGDIGTDAGGIVAVALWLPPGAFPWSPRRQARASPALLRTALAAPRAAVSFARLGAAAARTAPGEAHWHLEALGVHPRAQHRGWGDRVIRPGLQRADADGLPCYVETSDPANVGFYSHFGFEVAAPTLDHLAHGPAYIGMRRPPGDPDTRSRVPR